MARRRATEGGRSRPRPHRLAVYWHTLKDEAGGRACELLVPAGVLRLNPTALAIWERIDGRRDEAAITAALAAAYAGTDRAELAAAVSALLAQLESLGAVVRRWTPLDPCPVPRAHVPQVPVDRR